MRERAWIIPAGFGVVAFIVALAWGQGGGFVLGWLSASLAGTYVIARFEGAEK